MKTQVIQIITSASEFLPNPRVLAVLTAVVVVSLATGLVGRVVMCVEDLRYRRRFARPDGQQAR
jgi:hypothetical protein